MQEAPDEEAPEQWEDAGEEEHWETAPDQEQLAAEEQVLAEAEGVENFTRFLQQNEEAAERDAS